MKKSDFFCLVEALAELEPGSAQLHSKLVDIGWDSLCVIGLISDLDRMGINATNTETINGAETIDDLYEAVFGG